MRKHYRYIFQFAPTNSPCNVAIIRVRVVDVDRTGELYTCVKVDEDGNYIGDEPFIAKRHQLFKTTKAAKEYLSNLVRKALQYFDCLEQYGAHGSMYYFDGLSSTYNMPDDIQKPMNQKSKENK